MIRAAEISQDLKDHLNEIDKKIVAIQNNVQIMLNELDKTIRETCRIIIRNV